MAYLYLDGHYWGKGATKREALKQYRRAGGREKAENISVYECPADYWVDEAGNGHGSATVKHVRGPDRRN